MEIVTVNHGDHKEIDIKNYAKVEKIPGGQIEDCRVLKGGCWSGLGGRCVLGGWRH